MRTSLVLVVLVALAAGCGGKSDAVGGAQEPLACGQGAVSAACACGGATVTSGWCCAGVAQATACGSATGSALLVDHRAAAAFSTIPGPWLEAAKTLALHYAHTSHGSQIVTGLEQLERRDARYAFARREASTEGLPPAETPPALRIYDGQPGATYITPDLYWDGDAGLASTRAVAATGHYDVSMWAWCGQQSTNDTATVDRYLSRMAALEGQYPGMRFVVMTGHSRGADEAAAAQEPITRNNDLVRRYAAERGLVLYDFEDIESWDPGGTHHATTDACSWCQAWCDAHPADCSDLGQMGDCAHTHALNCIQKAKAFWWMMARLAGWDGN